MVDSLTQPHYLKENSMAAEELRCTQEGMSWPFHMTDVQQWIKRFEKSIWRHVVWQLWEKVRAPEPEQSQKTSKKYSSQFSCTGFTKF